MKSSFKVRVPKSVFVLCMRAYGTPSTSCHPTPTTTTTTTTTKAQTYAKNDVIVARGSPNGTFYLVTHGTVHVRRSAQDSATPRAAITGDDFGSIGLEGQGTEAMHVTAASDSVAVLAVTREELLEVVGDPEAFILRDGAFDSLITTGGTFDPREVS